MKNYIRYFYIFYKKLDYIMLEILIKSFIKYSKLELKLLKSLNILKYFYNFNFY